MNSSNSPNKLNRPNPGNNVYLIRLDKRPDITQWNVFKLDRDGEHENTYQVIQVERAGEMEFTCTCPSYKPFCKHISWVKFLRQKTATNKDAAIVGGRYFPKEGTWQFERDTDWIA